MNISSRFAICLILLSSAIDAGAVEPVTLENVKSPGPNVLDEPTAEFSLEKAAHFLDSASLQWQKQRKCFTCHTNFAYLYARPFLGSDSTAHRQVRSFAEELVRVRWKEKGPRWDAEVVAAAASLAYNDALVDGKLHDATKHALDKMWTLQRDDGGWDWLKCDWPPMESDDHYGATLAAIAVGIAPEKYKETPAAIEGMKKLKGYLANTPSETLHHDLMKLWASTFHQGILDDDAKTKIIDQLFDLQLNDGGWAIASLGDWSRQDDKQQDKSNSDGYGTGFSVFALRTAGISASDSRIEKGVRWLKQNQRKSGRWITRSLTKDNKHFISHAGTAFAVMAIASCDETKNVSIFRARPGVELNSN